MDDSSCLACLDLRLHTYLPKVSGHDVKFISVELLFFLLFLFFSFLFLNFICIRCVNLGSSCLDLRLHTYLTAHFCPKSVDVM